MKNLAKTTSEVINSRVNNSNDTNTSSDNIASIKSVIKSKTNMMNIKTWGFKQAAQLHGSIKGLHNSMGIISANYINEESKKQGEKYNQINEDIKVVVDTISDTNASLSEVKNVKIPEQRNIMEDYKMEIDEVNTKAGQDYIKSQFSWVATIMSTFFAILLGFALFTFYTSLVYSSLFKDFNAVIQNATVDNFSMLFNSLFDISVFQNINMVTAFSFILASVFTSIAFAMHKMWENKESNSRYYKVFVLALVALLMEVFFAVKLEKNIYDLKVMTGQAEVGLSTWELVFTVDVAIVLILGFVSYIVWSVILSITFNEWGKRDYKRLAVLKTKELNKKIGRAKYRISELNNDLSNFESDLSKLQSQLKDLQTKLLNAFFDTNELDGRLRLFFQGWLNYIKNNDNIKGQVDIHTQLFDEYKLELLSSSPEAA